jgi:hypothetical protein
MVLRIFLVVIGITAFVWAPAYSWYKLKNTPKYRTHAALFSLANLALGLALGLSFLVEVPAAIILIGILAYFVFRMVGMISLRRLARNEDKDCMESPGDTPQS